MVAMARLDCVGDNPYPTAAMPKMRSLSAAPFSALLVLAAVGCSSSASPASPPADSGVADAPDPSTIHLQMNVTVPAGKEIFRCQLAQLPKTDSGEIFVSGYSHEYTPGSHHYLVYRTSLTSIPAGLDQPFDCAEGGGVMKYASDYVWGGQVPKETRNFPSGVALALKSQEIVVLQAHYINATKGDVAATVNVDVHTVTAAQVQHRAGILRMYDPYIHVPAKAASATAQLRCPVRKDITVFSAVPHMHARGVSHTSWVDAPGSTATTPLLVNDDWEHPKQFDGSLDIKAGSSVRFQCIYKNDTDREIYQGQSADDEMCMFTAFYYPQMSIDDENCFTEGDWMGNGTVSCADSTTCIQGCPAGEAPRPAPGLTGVDVGPCFQSCVANSCPNAAGPMFKQFGCISDKCAAECSGGGSGCVSCALAKCPTEVNACQSLACDK